MNILKYSIVLFLVIAVFGCAAKMTPLERATTTGVELSHLYVDAHEMYLGILPVVSESKQVFMKQKIAPVLDNLRRAIIAYNSAVILWSAGAEKPGHLGALEAEILGLLTDVYQLFQEVL